MTNIAEILKNAPKGLKLYSPICGEVRLKSVANGIVRVDTPDGDKYFFKDLRSSDINEDAECLLCPSCNHITWNNWQNTLFLESIGSVCVDTITGNKFILCKNGTFFSDSTGSMYDTLIDGRDSSNYLLQSRYATPEEAVKFLEDLEKNGYKWDGESQNVVKIDHCKDCINDKGCMNCEDGELKETIPHLPLEDRIAILEDEVKKLKEQLNWHTHHIMTPGYTQFPSGFHRVGSTGETNKV